MNTAILSLHPWNQIDTYSSNVLQQDENLVKR